MKKTVIYNLATRSYAVWKDGKLFFTFHHTAAEDFLTREQAELVIKSIVPLLTQKTKENEFWCDGFALTVLEVYV